MRSHRAVVIVASLMLSGSVACSKEEPRINLPPPLPVVPAQPPADEPDSELAPSAQEERTRPAKSSPATPSPSRAAKASPSAPKAADKPAKASAPRPADEPAKASAPAASAPPPVAASKPVPAPKKTRVIVPSTAHVRAELPAGLQQDLDEDPRMQSWLDRVIAIADGCHAQARGNRGTIEAVITMHENSRPDADVRSVPSQLGGVVACATGALLRTKMPLFTGREGARYVVRLHFQ